MTTVRIYDHELQDAGSMEKASVRLMRLAQERGIDPQRKMQVWVCPNGPGGAYTEFVQEDDQ